MFFGEKPARRKTAGFYAVIIRHRKSRASARMRAGDN
jgi:hypothetical protein